MKTDRRDDMTFADKLIYLRRQNRCSQESLAETLNVTRQTISKWELGTSQPSMDMIVLLSDHFHVSTDYLLREDTPLEDNELAKVVLRFLNSSQSMEAVSKKLVAIARDGVIDDEEKKMLVSISKSIEEVQQVIDELQALIATALAE